MAIIVDRNFWQAMGTMITVNEISNCDIAWFVVDYMDRGELFQLTEGEVFYTTLERAVEGLTGGVPTSLEAFEGVIRSRLQ